jgi:putative two-component system response regulator
MVDAPVSSSVMVIDDAPSNLAILEAMLQKEGYDVKTFLGGEAALAEAAASPPDIVLLDICMPQMDGYEVCEYFRANEALREIPVVFISGRNDTLDKVHAFDVGGVDFITKPFRFQEVIARVKTHLELRHARIALRSQNEILAEKVLERTKDIGVTQDVMIHGLAVLAEYRDNETGSHIMRTQRYVATIASHLKDHPRFREALADTGVESVTKSAPLHDIGKVGIPDSILIKPGKLTAEEFDQMKSHTTIGRDTLRKAEEDMGVGGDTSFLRTARQITIAHHERWDGTGYPFGLAEEEIPIPARIMTICDIYDALVSKRTYKEAFSHERAVEIISCGDGRVEPSHFDPAVLEAFLDTNEELRRAVESMPDDQAYALSNNCTIARAF